MKLNAEINGTSQEVELRREGETVIASVSGREFTLDAAQPEPGVYLFKNGSEVIQASVAGTEDVSVAVRGREYSVRIIDPKRLRGSASSSQHETGRAEIRTAMPGKVVRILAAVGDEVTTGDGVIVVEAMKMQNEMRSPKDGTVTEIRASEGETVAAGDILIVIE